MPPFYVTFIDFAGSMKISFLSLDNKTRKYIMFFESIDFYRRIVCFFESSGLTMK